MLKIHLLGIIAALSLGSLLASVFIASAQVPEPVWLDKIDPWLQTKARQASLQLNSPEDGRVEFLIGMKEQADLKEADLLSSKVEKGRYVFHQLTSLAQQTQEPVLSLLNNQGVETRSFWIANLIWVRADWATIQELAQRSDVAHLYANPSIQTRLPEPEAASAQAQAFTLLQWNLLKVGVDRVWETGDRGQGVVIGGQDTGYQWDHPALKNHYRGWNGSSVDHNYNWHDAIHQSTTGNPCGAGDLQAPCDDYGHGTHTMGIMVGDDGSGNPLGMSPASQWIGCRNMDIGVGTPASYIECFQWFLAPTDLHDQNPDPAKAPDVINNSWSCPPSEGCNPNSLLDTVRAVRSAGIMVVASAGNYGPSCETIRDPIAIYDEVFTVGNTQRDDSISISSSRGPVTVDGSNRLKPDIAAPGTGIYSSKPGNSYGTLSGTSMAAPHVSGLVALLISAQPALRGHINEIETLIEQNAIPLTTTALSCGTIPNTQVPNNTYGWGRIDAYQSVVHVPQSLEVSSMPNQASVLPNTDITYTFTITHVHPISTTTSIILTDTLPTNTTFITATLPMSLNGNVVRWEFPSLGPGVSQTVQLVIRAPDSPGPLLNWDYGAKSADAPYTSGTPIRTWVGWQVYLPVISMGK